MTAHSTQAGDSSSIDALALDRVTYAYGARVALRAVSLRVGPGEVVGLLGPNGAGKSTLIRLAAGTIAPSSGRIALWGDLLARLDRAEVARRVAVVPQEFSVQFAYTVRQIVALGRLPHTGLLHIPRPADEAAVDVALAATNLEAFADRIFNELSGGERQRVLVALALAQDARLILLDEPTAHLDIKHQIAVLELLRALNRERGLTIVAALHDLNLAARFFPRLVLLQQEVVADGPPAAVLDGALLSRVYATPVRVGILRGEAHLSVLPPGEARGAPPIAPARIHVIAGGGSGELLMRALADAAIPFTAGPLNIGDSDQVLAERLAVTCLMEPPFAPVSTAGLAAARDLMRRAGTVVIAPIALGHGNVALLDAALEALSAGTAILLLEPAAESDDASDPYAAICTRDFSGQGEEHYRTLEAAGAHRVGSPAEVVAALRANERSGESHLQRDI